MKGFKAIADFVQEIHLTPKDTAVNNKQDDVKTMSVAAMDAVKRGIITGVLRSLCMHIFSCFPDPKVQASKVQTLVNAMRAAGDIDVYAAKWLVNNYYEDLKCAREAVDVDACDAPCSYAYLSWYSCLDNLLSDVRVYEWSFNCEKGGEVNCKLNDDETALVKEYRQASEAYYAAKSRFENYFREVNRKTLSQILIRYGTTLQQIDPEWYKQVAHCAGVTNDCQCEECGEAPAAG